MLPLLLIGFVSPVHAETLSLVSAWERARLTEPAWRMAQADADIEREERTKVRASLLPQIAITKADNRNSVDYASGTSSSYYSGTTALTLRQPLFRMQSISEYYRSGVRTEIALYRLALEEKSLALRVSQAYFDVLQTQDVIRLANFQESNLQTQLDAARKSFKAGSGTRIDIDEARARLAVATAERIAAVNAAENARRRLTAIVGTTVTGVLRLDEQKAGQLKLSPASVTEWIAVTKTHSPELAAAVKGVEEASQSVFTARAGHLPTVDLVASRGRSESDTVSTLNNRYDTSSIGVQLNIPLFSGGYTQAEVTQAQAKMQRAIAARENTERQLETRIIQEFNGIVQGEERIASLAIAIEASREAAISTTRGVQAGTRTVLDVLNAERQEYVNHLDRARARYEWIMSRMRLQALAGKLGEAEIREINALMSATACNADCPEEAKVLPILTSAPVQTNFAPASTAEPQPEVRPEPPPTPITEPAVEPTPTQPDAMETQKSISAEVPSPAPAMKAATSSEPKMRNEPRPNGKFAVQLGVFGNPENVTRLLAATDKLNVPAYTEPFNDKLMRVRAGPYATRAEALKALALLKDAGIAGVLTRR